MIPAPRLDRAEQIVELIKARDVRATDDVTKALANLPCVLVTPPRLEFDLPTGATATWRLVCLAASTAAGQKSAWRELDVLVVACRQALNVERADPGSYLPPAGVGSDRLPAYIVTFTEAVD